MALDWSQCEVVESVPGKLSGAWVFRGTRIPVSAVFENLEEGRTIDQIVKMFDGLTRDRVRAVLDFAVRSLEASAIDAENEIEELALAGLESGEPIEIRRDYWQEKHRRLEERLNESHRR